MTALEDQITELEQENETLTEEKADLTDELESAADEIKALEEENETLTEDLEEAGEKADFMDTYVVFVNNDDTDYYHNYDCSQFIKTNFWAYSRKLAENYGYTACPTCGG